MNDLHEDRLRQLMILDEQKKQIHARTGWDGVYSRSKRQFIFRAYSV
jgi:hypothetical protein